MMQKRVHHEAESFLMLRYGDPSEPATLAGVERGDLEYDAYSVPGKMLVLSEGTWVTLF